MGPGGLRLGPRMDEAEPDLEGPPSHDHRQREIFPPSLDAVSVVSSTPVSLGPDPLGDGATLSEV